MSWSATCTMACMASWPRPRPPRPPPRPLPWPPRPNNKEFTHFLLLSSLSLPCKLGLKVDQLSWLMSRHSFNEHPLGRGGRGHLAWVPTAAHEEHALPPTFAAPAAPAASAVPATRAVLPSCAPTVLPTPLGRPLCLDMVKVGLAWPTCKRKQGAGLQQVHSGKRQASTKSRVY